MPWRVARLRAERRATVSSRCASSSASVRADSSSSRSCLACSSARLAALELVLPPLVLGDQPRVLERDRGLIGERRQQRHRRFGEAPAAAPVLEVQHADRTRAPADRQARHRAQHQLVHRHELAQPAVARRVDGHDRLAVDQHRLGDRTAEGRVRVGRLATSRSRPRASRAGRSCRRAARSRARRPTGPPRDSVMRCSRRSRSCSLASRLMMSSRRSARASPISVARSPELGGALLRALLVGHRALARGAPPRVVPERLAVLARDAQRDVLEHLDREPRAAPLGELRAEQRRAPAPPRTARSTRRRGCASCARARSRLRAPRSAPSGSPDSRRARESSSCSRKPQVRQALALDRPARRRQAAPPLPTRRPGPPRSSSTSAASRW